MVKVWLPDSSSNRLMSHTLAAICILKSCRWSTNALKTKLTCTRCSRLISNCLGRPFPSTCKNDWRKAKVRNESWILCLATFSIWVAETAQWLSTQKRCKIKCTLKLGLVTLKVLWTIKSDSGSIQKQDSYMENPNRKNKVSGIVKFVAPTFVQLLQKSNYMVTDKSHQSRKRPWHVLTKKQ